MLRDIQKGKLYYLKYKYDFGTDGVKKPNCILRVETGPGAGKTYRPGPLTAMAGVGKHLVLALDDLQRCDDWIRTSSPDNYAYVRVLYTDKKDNQKILMVVINSNFKTQDVFDGPLK